MIKFLITLYTSEDNTSEDGLCLGGRKVIRLPPSRKKEGGFFV